MQLFIAVLMLITSMVSFLVRYFWDVLSVDILFLYSIMMAITPSLFLLFFFDHYEKANNLYKDFTIIISPCIFITFLNSFGIINGSLLILDVNFIVLIVGTIKEGIRKMEREKNRVQILLLIISSIVSLFRFSGGLSKMLHLFYKVKEQSFFGWLVLVAVVVVAVLVYLSLLRNGLSTVFLGTSNLSFVLIILSTNHVFVSTFRINGFPSTFLSVFLSIFLVTILFTDVFIEVDELLGNAYDKYYGNVVNPCIIAFYLFVFDLEVILVLILLFGAFLTLMESKNLTHNVLVASYSMVVLYFLSGDLWLIFSVLLKFSSSGILFILYVSPAFLSLASIAFTFIVEFFPEQFIVLRKICSFYKKCRNQMAVAQFVVISFTAYFYFSDELSLFYINIQKMTIKSALFFLYLLPAILAITALVLTVIIEFFPGQFHLQREIISFYNKCRNQRRVAQFVVISSTAFFYFSDGISSLFLSIRNSTIISVFFILYLLPAFLAASASVLTLFVAFFPQNFDIPLKIIIFHKKYNNKIKVALVFDTAFAILFYSFRGLSASLIFMYAFGITGVIILLYLLIPLLYQKIKSQRRIVRVNSIFQHRDLVKATNNFSEKLGSGGSGSVYKGKLDDGTLIAVKCIERLQIADRVFQAEVSIIQNVDHAHLVSLRGYCRQMKGTEVDLFIVYDLFPKGSLDKWIFPPKKGRIGNCLPWKLRYRVAIEVAEALAYLHDRSPRTLHLDIKPENILLDDEFQAVVADFGLSKLMNEDQSRIQTTIRGTPGYMAPEWYSSKGISEKCDIYSFGMVLLDICFGQRYVCLNQNGDDIYKAHGNSQEEQQTFHAFLWEKLAHKKILDAIDKVNGDFDQDEVKSLLYVALWCLKEDPKERPDMRQVVHMLRAKKLDDITGISTGEFCYNGGEDNQRKVARLSRKFRHKELEIVTNHFCEKLGSGRSGSVFKGILKNEKTVIVRQVETTTYEEWEFHEEVSFLDSLRHDQLINLRGHCCRVENTGNSFLFVYDFFSKGSLDRWIFPHKGCRFFIWGQRYRVAKDIAKALKYLHGRNILHLNLKPENIFLDDDFEVVVSGFGQPMSLRKNGRRDHLMAVRGVAGYMAPKWFIGETSKQCDIFSYGLILLDMFFGERNVCFDGSGRRNDITCGISREDWLKFSKYMWQVSSTGNVVELIHKGIEMVNKREARSLLQTALCCLHEDPDQRPDMQGVIEMLK